MAHRIAARAEIVTNVGLGFLLAAILAAETAETAARHGYWPFGLAVGLIVGVAALLRGRDPVRAATVGLALCAVADVVGDVARLASGPGFAATAGLLVLGAAAVRVAVARTSVLVAIAGVVVLVAGRLTGRHEYIVPLAFLGVLAWGAALGIGIWLRSVDARHRLAIETARRDERLDLASREIDVVRAIARGRTNTEIAAGLFISLSTVKSHLASIQYKLGVRNRVEIAAWAWGTGLIQPAAD